MRRIDCGISNNNFSEVAFEKIDDYGLSTQLISALVPLLFLPHLNWPLRLLLVCEKLCIPSVIHSNIAVLPESVKTKQQSKRIISRNRYISP